MTLVKQNHFWDEKFNGISSKQKVTVEILSILFPWDSMEFQGFVAGWNWNAIDSTLESHAIIMITRRTFTDHFQLTKSIDSSW